VAAGPQELKMSAATIKKINNRDFLFIFSPPGNKDMDSG
jgi:hypothetical protein